jgi:hypothetical protein
MTTSEAELPSTIILLHVASTPPPPTPDSKVELTWAVTFGVINIFNAQRVLKNL